MASEGRRETQPQAVGNDAQGLALPELLEVRNDRLLKAKQAADAFVEAYYEACAADERAKDDLRGRGYRINADGFESPSKQVAALKRRSLDLTRALADLRKRENQ